MRTRALPTKVPFLQLAAVFLLLVAGPAYAQTVQVVAQNPQLTIMHTNDMHSHFLGAPNADYTPETTNDDATIGGIARIATKVKEVRADRGPRGIPVLLLDGGDFTMGTLFHLLEGEAEMDLMNYLGYDAITLGNHEFDWLPIGTANIVSHANGLPVLATNLVVRDTSDPGGAAIQALIDSGAIKSTHVQVLANGSKVGYFGLMGENAESVVNRPYGAENYPLEFTDRFQAAVDAVAELRNNENVDIVICLSHSGVEEPNYWEGEDVDLANAVPGIDVIISGHTHTLIPYPVVTNNTIIVQAKCYTQRLGVLDIEQDPSGTWNLANYEMIVVDDSIPGDADTQALVQAKIEEINTQILGPMGKPLFSDQVAETDFDLRTHYAEEHGLGNLVTDAIRWSVDQYLPDPGDHVEVAVESDGVIRDALLKGSQGRINTSDAFRTLPLGIDPVTRNAGYPMVSFCLYGEELFKAAWVNALAPYLDNSDYWLSWSGAGFTYTDYLPPLSMWLCLDPDDPTCAARVSIRKNKSRLYRVAVNSYVASNIASIEELSYGLIKIEPKDCETGAPLASMEDAYVYKAPGEPLMQWEGFLDFLAQLPDTDGDGVPNIPERYAGPEGRMVKACVVATVSYGSPFEEKVEILRQFRDEILMKSRAGRAFVDFYYTHGGALAEPIAQSEWMKAAIRILLLPLVGVAKVLLWIL